MLDFIKIKSNNTYVSSRKEMIKFTAPTRFGKMKKDHSTVI